MLGKASSSRVPPPRPFLRRFTALIVAAHNGHVAAAEALLARGAAVDAAGKNEITPLHAAAGRGHAAMVEAWIDHSLPTRPRDAHSKHEHETAA
jgi:ankyrin repeat protein